ncbi:MAG TPA: helix-turn-helix domain-containing protein [Acidimicrobiales bacterium]|nr:helix-turn-helix domain-containing protein [Acidimicrobiales bacterium]
MSEDAAGVGRRVAAVGEKLADRVDDLTDDIQELIIDLIPHLRSDATRILHHSIRENIETALHGLATLEDSTEATAPASAVEYAQALALADVPPTALIRAYRVGQTRFLRRCIEEVLETASNDHVDVLVTLQIVESVSTRLDRVVEQVYTAYEEARELKLRDRSAVLTGRVRDLLRDKPVDIDAAEVAIAYRLRQSHVAAVVWSDDAALDALVRLRRFTTSLGQALGCDEQPLFVAADERLAWVWLPTRVDLARSPELGEVAKADLTVAVAVGEPGRDVDGFRRSHRQAISAHGVAVSAGVDRAQITPFADVAPIATLCADMVSARAWVRETLGALAVDTSRNAGLRETARVFLETGGSYTATAEQLILHRNTAQYRVRQAEEVRGRPLRERRLDVELALLACQWLKGAVLEPAS